MIHEVFLKALASLCLILILLGAAAYMTWCERIVMARMQLRIGPHRVGPWGLLQPIADGIKLLAKERFQPGGIDPITYWAAPGISLLMALLPFAIIPFGSLSLLGFTLPLHIADLNAGVLFLLACSSLAVYGVVLAGWSSNSRYALLGGLRGTAQMISYEIPMGLSLLTVALFAGSLRLTDLVEAQKDQWFLWSNPIGFVIYLITGFAETNRAPFDLPEAEQELTAGYHTEYGGMKFALFFLAEYIHILAVSSILVTLFLGGWHGPFDLPVVWFLVKVAAMVFLFMWVRATFPRFRYDQLMNFGWTFLLPLATVNLIFTAYWVTAR